MTDPCVLSLSENSTNCRDLTRCSRHFHSLMQNHVVYTAAEASSVIFNYYVIIRV